METAIYRRKWCFDYPKYLEDHLKVGLTMQDHYDLWHVKKKVDLEGIKKLKLSAA